VLRFCEALAKVLANVLLCCRYKALLPHKVDQQQLLE
jgi:hypothetical protein